jgi:hypothetical protein
MMIVLASGKTDRQTVRTTLLPAVDKHHEFVADLLQYSIVVGLWYLSEARAVYRCLNLRRMYDALWILNIIAVLYVANCKVLYSSAGLRPCCGNFLQQCCVW